MRGKIKPNKTIKNVLGIVEGEKIFFKIAGKLLFNFTYTGRGQKDYSKFF